MIKLFAAAGAAIILAGCASAPTPDEVSRADYGKAMTEAECRAIVEPFLADRMKDPSSVQFRHTACEKGYWGASPILGQSTVFGYFQSGQINAKNSYGGYVGFKPYKALIRDGVVVRHCITDNDGICMPTGL